MTDVFHDDFGNAHQCRANTKFACDAVIENEITGALVCRFSGRIFGTSAIFVTHTNETEEEEEREEREEVKKTDSNEFQAIVRQVVVSNDFPIEAYTLELVRLYKKYNANKYFTSIQEYVISTLYLMCEGFGDACAPNRVLTDGMLKQNELKSVKVDKTLITSGNKHWQTLFKTHENDVQTQRSSHLFSLKRRKVNEIHIHSHAELMNIYDKIKMEENKYLFDL
jgi:hypothetical protein